MKTLKITIILAIIAGFGACSMLQEENEGALGSTYTSLYAFFEAGVAGSIGCYPDSNNNSNTSTYTPYNTLKADYIFQVERPTTLVACVKAQNPYDGNTSSADYLYYEALKGNVRSHFINFLASNSKVNPGSPDLVDYPMIPPIAGSVPNSGVVGSLLGSLSDVCPFDSTAALVGKYDMEALKDYQYITAADEACGLGVGTGMSPFTLAKKFGVVY